MGAQVTPVAFNEIYLALQTGTVQGQDNPVATDVANKFYEVTKQLILTNHVFSPVMPSINESVWQKLSTSEQQAIVKAFQDADTWADQQVQNTQDAGIALMQQHGAAGLLPRRQGVPDRGAEVVPVRPDLDQSVPARDAPERGAEHRRGGAILLVMAS